MTPEQLLKPRYKVIAHYPNAPQVNIGFIYDRNNEEWTEMWWNQMSHFPHLFKKLEWWEDREPDEMPKYVKRYRLERWQVFMVTKYNNIGVDVQTIDGGIFYSHYKLLKPATEQEYNQQTKTSNP